MPGLRPEPGGRGTTRAAYFSAPGDIRPSPCGSVGAEVAILTLLGVGREPLPTLVFCAALVPTSVGFMLGEGESNDMGVSFGWG